MTDEFGPEWCRSMCRAIVQLAPLVAGHAGAFRALRTFLETVESTDWSGAEDEVFDARHALKLASRRASS